MLENRNFWLTILNFKKQEFSCKCGCGHNIISENLIEKLNKARYIADTPFSINSATRCNKHNTNVKGSDNSAHLKGLAVDIAIVNSLSRSKVLKALLLAGFNRIGVYKDFIHADIDTSKTQNVVWYK